MCMLGWLCVLAKPFGIHAGIHAGAERGATALTPLGLRPKQGRFGCLPKVHDAKPTKQATLDTPFSKII